MKMTEFEFNQKLTEYTIRNNFWTDKTITQLGYSINLFTTFGIALLGFLIGKKCYYPYLDIGCDSEFSLNLTLYLISILLVFISIFFGVKSILSRLFDFRITRHIALIRKRFLSKNKDNVFGNRKMGLLSDEIIDISNMNYNSIFFFYLKGKFDFINDSDFENNNIHEKFKKLRTDSKVLGDITWKTHRFQMVIFVLGIFFYGLSVLFN